MRFIDRQAVIAGIKRQYHPARVFDKPFGGRQCQLVLSDTQPENVRQMRDTLPCEHQVYDVIIRDDRTLLFSIKTNT